MMSNLSAQDNMTKDYLWKYQGKKKEHTIGGYLGLSGSYTDVMGKPAGLLGGQIGIVIDKRYTIGLMGNALWYDYTLDDAVETGTYHLECGYSGLFFEYMQPIGARVKISLSVATGMGIAKYTYDKEYRDTLAWYQRTIDTHDFSFIEPGAGVLVKVAPKWWLGLNGSYRATSPVKLPATSEQVLNNFSAGVTVRFGLF
jgi:hypothetical protein